MRNGQHQHQHKRMRGRSHHQHNNRKNQNPLTRVYESNGPDVKIRGTASHVAEKYMQLARDASTSGDHVTAENYYQHAEHYLRLIAAAQEQFRQQNPYYRPEPEGETRDDTFDDADEGTGQPMQGQPNFGNQQPQPPRDAQPYPGREPQPSFSGREQQQPRPPQQHQQQYQQNQQPSGNTEVNDGEQLPSFITGGGQPQQNYGQNGDGNQGGDRFRRRRRHRGPHGNLPGGAQEISGNQAPDDPRSGNE